MKYQVRGVIWTKWFGVSLSFVYIYILYLPIYIYTYYAAHSEI